MPFCKDDHELPFLPPKLFFSHFFVTCQMLIDLLFLLSLQTARACLCPFDDRAIDQNNQVEKF